MNEYSVSEKRRGRPRKGNVVFHKRMSPAMVERVKAFLKAEGIPVPSNPSHSDEQVVSTPTPSVIEASRMPDSEVKALRDRMTEELIKDNDKLKREVVAMLPPKPEWLGSAELAAAKKRISFLEKKIKEYEQYYS